ncbi:MAG: hypothetical protein COB36_13140 [Alphaproteobacteria bacterium]|nr:MAG: hypothetical protein COB36_13140 [Alphaproteobacteria bacterium]
MGKQSGAESAAWNKVGESFESDYVGVQFYVLRILWTERGANFGKTNEGIAVDFGRLWNINT